MIKPLCSAAMIVIHRTNFRTIFDQLEKKDPRVEEITEMEVPVDVINKIDFIEFIVSTARRTGIVNEVADSKQETPSLILHKQR